jgi:hypothetical protein
MRARSSSLKRPTCSLYTRIASRTTSLLGLDSRQAVRSSRRDVASSNVNVLLMVAIMAYYHLTILMEGVWALPPHHASSYEPLDLVV